MASKSKRARMAPAHNPAKKFMYWAAAIFVIKLVIILNIQGGNIEIYARPFFLDGIWLGADGENYLKGFEALSKEGIFAKEVLLSYWPAGYPLIIYLISLIGKGFTLTLLSILQSSIFSWSVYYFALQLSRTRLKKFAGFVFFLILLNPTLSLNSIAVGYESLTASGFLIAVALIIKDLLERNEQSFIWYLFLNSVILGLLVFMQPRLIIAGILVNLVWIFSRKRIRISALLTVFSLLIILFFPASLIYRNHVSTGINSVSTNLGATMNIGAGDTASGGYAIKWDGVPCNLSGTEAQQDNQRIKCVLQWYVNNPSKSLKLFYNKTQYFWSPWYGPLANGTMARNPWLTINPVKNITSNQEGLNLVVGGFGQLVSWLWLLGGLFLLVYGFVILWRQRYLERVIAVIAMIIISSNWLISLFSIGDHRFRLPIMGMSLFLQAVGLRTLFSGFKPPMVEGPSLR